MEWIDVLDQWDRELMLWMNNEGNVSLDCFFALFTGKWEWVVAAVTILFTLCYRCQSGWRLSLTVVLLTVLLICLTDQVSSTIIKPLVSRPRPSHTDGLSELLHYVGNYRGGRFGFVSSHAANSVGFTVWLSLLFRGALFRITMGMWALINCFSRIYLSVHYPGDIICGALLGALLALGVWWIFRGLRRFVLHADRATLGQDYEQNPQYIISVVWATMLLIGLLAIWFPRVNPMV
jgi:undecaprenyl-diphosphatase